LESHSWERAFFQKTRKYIRLKRGEVRSDCHLIVEFISHGLKYDIGQEKECESSEKRVWASIMTIK
jgi:hypothetical protein